MFLTNLLISGLAVFVTAYILDGVVVDNYLVALLVSVLLGLANAVLKPILLIFTLPINILTLGLFTFVINAIMVIIVSSVVAGFTVTNFWWALLFSLLLSVVNSILLSLVKK
ncbi:MAG: phage holin family protein [Patescibacteria group bacterium]|jgi:putative membrane protein